MREDFEPFENAEEVWFWFCTSASARSGGLRSKSDYWGKPRCCELPDIQRIIKQMKRNHHWTTASCALWSNGGCFRFRHIMSAVPKEAKYVCGKRRC